MATYHVSTGPALSLGFFSLLCIFSLWVFKLWSAFI